jgi:hypothetical protein
MSGRDAIAGPAPYYEGDSGDEDTQRKPNSVQLSSETDRGHFSGAPHPETRTGPAAGSDRIE